LPSSFEALFHQVARKRCASCHATPDSRAVCLACAAHLCGIDTPHGARAIMGHAATCGAGTGLFLLTSNSAAVLVRDRRLVFAGSPYRDAHGEVDIGLLRGKPLTLDPTEYGALSKQWLNLAFDETARNEDEQLPMGL
jgi:E3 ubiquitin-protein ligase UBR1